MEPAFLELDNPTKPVTEELPEQPPLTPEEVRSEPGHAESLPVDQSRPGSSPCLEKGERSSASQYPEEGTSAVPIPVPESSAEAAGPEIPEAPRRSARKRKRQGYYKLQRASCKVRRLSKERTGITGIFGPNMFVIYDDYV